MSPRLILGHLQEVKTVYAATQKTSLRTEMRTTTHSLRDTTVHKIEKVR